MRWDDGTISEGLEHRAELFPVAGADLEVPYLPGFYGIFVDVVESFPKPFDQILRESGTRLIYIGVASVSLHERLIEQDMRGRNPSTFFRGIGAILGFRPAIGSLVGKRNQNNYRFSKVDSELIMEWCRRHLSVRFVAVDTLAFSGAEKCAIGRNCPILNTTHNSRCCGELAELRNLCRVIGRTAAS